MIYIAYGDAPKYKSTNPNPILYILKDPLS